MRNAKIGSLMAADRRLAIIFFLPAFLFLAVFMFIPIGYSLYMSLFDWTIFDLGRGRVFVGFDNFIRMFQDQVFKDVITNTLKLVSGCLVIEILLGFLVSIGLWSIKRKLRVLHSFILLPMIVAPVIVAVIWRFMYDPMFGIINFVMRSAGLETVAWLARTDTALLSIMIMDVWQMTPFVIMVFYAGLTVVPMENVESASIDGASYLQMIRHIVIPSIAPLIFFTMMIRAMDLIRIFDAVFILTRGGPGTSTETISTFIYRMGFSQYEMGYATALSMLTLFAILIISIPFVRAMRRREG